VSVLSKGLTVSLQSLPERAGRGTHNLRPRSIEASTLWAAVVIIMEENVEGSGVRLRKA
jgi:hypothetical protein